MGIPKMGFEGGGGDSNGKQSQFPPLVRSNSLYSLTLDEVQNQLGDIGKPLNSMNLDELLKNVWTAEANQSLSMDIEGTSLANQTTTLQRQASLSLTSALSKKTVDEVWRDIQQIKNNEEKRSSQERQPTLGEMTLEDFLVKAGVVAEGSGDKKGAGSIVEVDAANVAPQFPQQQSQWMQYPQPQYQQSMMGVYMPGQPIPQPMHVGPGVVIDVPYGDSQVTLTSPLMGTLSDPQATGRKRGGPLEDVIEKTVERRQKRMIKNRESAARSRARKQAYTNELENKVSRLEEENERLRKRQELEKILPCAPPPEPKYQLRRTTSAPF